MNAALNPAQRDAVRYVEGPLLVLAGAGSGKTRVITAKIAHLVEQGVPPERILAITFTNKAALEMRERVRDLLAARGQQEAFQKITVCTFHALGLSIVRQEVRMLKLKPRFSILDPQDLETLISELTGSTARARAAQWQISQWKNALVSPEDALKNAGDDQALIAARAYVQYGDALQAYQAVDLDDLIVRPVHLFARDEGAAVRWGSRYAHVLIDEYQDTNPAQYALLRTLASDNAFTAVGDDDQAIYGWRGATLDNLAQLPRDYPHLKVVKLEQNYRSTVRILRSANALIANNEKLFDKKLWSDLGHGDTIRVTPANDDEAEAELIVHRLLAHKFEHRGSFGDYAILYRGNFQSRPFENALRANNVPYVLSGGQSFFDRTEVKDIVSYLRLIANDDDDPSFIRAITTPRRGVGQATLAKLGEISALKQVSLFAAVFSPEFKHTVTGKMQETVQTFCDSINHLRFRAEREPAGRLLDEMLKGIGYEDWLYSTHDKRDAEKRMEYVRDFTGWLAKKGEEDGKNLLDLTQMLMLMNRLDDQQDDGGQVRLSTLHAAKGLEFPHVFLVGVEEGILPHRESIELQKIDEERRLMYVGITRAQRTLHISYCKQRKRAGGRMDCTPSRFIGELAQEDLRYSGQALSADEAAAEKSAGKAKLRNLRAMLGGRD
ncbi:MAG: UvrD-helicase domain-containing protein [Proteobacteria bacterium]|nr:UvrD-helicase domain-containing protein [Pseudomonadota bacterium]MCL2308034.1 UvrD-helicase domain-containing protein [Pseudomonadota bacterium]